MSNTHNQFVDTNNIRELDCLGLSLRTTNQLDEIAKNEFSKTVEKCAGLISDIKAQTSENEMFMPSLTAIQDMVSWILSPDPQSPLDDQSQMRLRGYVATKTVIEAFREIYNERCQRPKGARKNGGTRKKGIKDAAVEVLKKGMKEMDYATIKKGVEGELGREVSDIYHILKSLVGEGVATKNGDFYILTEQLPLTTKDVSDLLKSTSQGSESVGAEPALELSTEKRDSVQETSSITSTCDVAP